MHACMHPAGHASSHACMVMVSSVPCRCNSVVIAVIILIRTYVFQQRSARTFATADHTTPTRTYPLYRWRTALLGHAYHTTYSTTLDRGPCARGPSVSKRTPCTQNHPGTGESGDISQRSEMDGPAILLRIVRTAAGRGSKLKLAAATEAVPSGLGPDTCEKVAMARILSVCEVRWIDHLLFSVCEVRTYISLQRLIVVQGCSSIGSAQTYSQRRSCV
jgi:hypothetical protein